MAGDPRVTGDVDTLARTYLEAALDEDHSTEKNYYIRQALQAFELPE